jgi:uncharacterized OB-fold protein
VTGVGPVARDQASAAFFDGTARGQLLLHRCRSCRSWWSPHAVQCAACGSTGLDREPSAGTAHLVSWSVSHGRAREDGSTARAVVGIVQLDEGPWWWAQLRTDDPAVLAVGDRVVVAFERSGDDSETVPVFAIMGP